MCGIFGWNINPSVDRPTKNKLRILANVLAHANDQRGGDSWGIFARYNNETSKTYKGLDKFSKCREGAIALNKSIHSRVLLGHTRKATKGTISVENAHPFKCGRVIGAHNGMVTNHDDLNHRFGRNCKVDSEHIFHHISEKRSTKEIRGWGAIEFVYENENPESVFLGKFNEGSLSVACVPNVGIVWSSTDWDLDEALNTAGFGNSTYYNVEKDRLYEARNDELYNIGDLNFKSYGENRTTTTYYHNVPAWENQQSFQKVNLKNDILNRLEEVDIDLLEEDEWKQVAKPTIHLSKYLECSNCKRLMGREYFCDICNLCNTKMSLACCTCSTKKKKSDHETWHDICNECGIIMKNSSLCSSCYSCKGKCCKCGDVNKNKVCGVCLGYLFRECKSCGKCEFTCCSCEEDLAASIERNVRTLALPAPDDERVYL